MVPLHLYRTNPASLRKPQWGIDTSVLSPWAVMSWGMKQLKGVVIGGEEATPRLQPQELVLVENLKVGWLRWLGFGPRLLEWVGLMRCAYRRLRTV